MSYIKMNPWRSFEEASRRFNEFANEIQKGATFEFGGYAPRTDIYEDANNYYLIVEVPGIAKEDIKITINEDGLLVIKGKSLPNEKHENVTLLRSERSFGEFTRAFTLPDNLDKSNIAAKVNDGVLLLTIKKMTPPAAKEIEIGID